MLIQAAWAAIRVRGRLQARYTRLVRRFGGDKNPGAKKKAITAIAHTLLKIAYQVLKSGRRTRSQARTSTPGGSPPSSGRPGWTASCKSSTRLHRHHHRQPAGGRRTSRRSNPSSIPTARSRRRPGTGPPAGQSSVTPQPSPPHRPGFAAARPPGTQFSCQSGRGSLGGGPRSGGCGLIDRGLKRTVGVAGFGGRPACLGRSGCGAARACGDDGGVAN